MAIGWVDSEVGRERTAARGAAVRLALVFSFWWAVAVSGLAWLYTDGPVQVARVLGLSVGGVL
jgi:hypothetical protein